MCRDLDFHTINSESEPVFKTQDHPKHMYPRMEQRRVVFFEGKMVLISESAKSTDPYLLEVLSLDFMTTSLHQMREPELLAVQAYRKTHGQGTAPVAVEG